MATEGDPGPGMAQAAAVRAMFDRIAGVYDAMNSVMTAGLHHRWRERAAELAKVGPGDRVLDVATGTGDLALELARRVAPGGSVVGADFAEAMLARARSKAAGQPGLPASVSFERADALALPYGDDRFDAATVAFGARNFEDLSKGLAEMVRVVGPGGHVVVLEITTPRKPPLASFYRLWFDRLVPILGRAVGLIARRVWTSRAEGIADAYEYLPASVRRFPGPEELAGEMARAGLEEVGYVLLAGGIIAIHHGRVGSGADGGPSSAGVGRALSTS